MTFGTRTVRRAMVMIMLPPTPQQRPGSSSGRDSDAPREITDSTHVSSAASTCMFWSAVALGGLAQGRPMTTVSRGVFSGDRERASTGTEVAVRAGRGTSHSPVKSLPGRPCGWFWRQISTGWKPQCRRAQVKFGGILGASLLNLSCFRMSIKHSCSCCKAVRGSWSVLICYILSLLCIIFPSPALLKLEGYIQRADDSLTLCANGETEEVAR